MEDKTKLLIGVSIIIIAFVIILIYRGEINTYLESLEPEQNQTNGTLEIYSLNETLTGIDLMERDIIRCWEIYRNKTKDIPTLCSLEDCEILQLKIRVSQLEREDCLNGVEKNIRRGRYFD